MGMVFKARPRQEPSTKHRQSPVVVRAAMREWLLENDCDMGKMPKDLRDKDKQYANSLSMLVEKTRVRYRQVRNWSLGIASAASGVPVSMKIIEEHYARCWACGYEQWVGLFYYTFGGIAGVISAASVFIAGNLILSSFNPTSENGFVRRKIVKEARLEEKGET